MRFRREKLYTVGQVASILGFDAKPGSKRVRRLIEAGKLEAEDHGSGDKRFWMVTESSLRGYLEERGRASATNEHLH